MKNTTIQTGVYHRKATLEKVADNTGNLVVASISSDKPYRRDFGLEVLCHDPKCVDLSRAKSGTVPFLLDHNQEKFIGKVKDVSLVGGRALATIQMGSSDLAREVLQEITSGTRTEVSIGYTVGEMELLRDREEETYLVTSWTLLEVSSVTVPADTSVGFGRSHNNKTAKTVIKDNKMKSKNDNIETSGSGNEREEVQAIMDIAQRSNLVEDGLQFIKKGHSVEQFKNFVLARMQHTPADTKPDMPTMRSNIGMSSREVEQYSLIRAADAVASGNWNNAGLELEIHRAVESDLGGTSHGQNSVYVPFDVIPHHNFSSIKGSTANTAHRAFSSTNGGSGLLANEILPEQLIDFLGNEGKIIEAGATILNGLSSDVDIPRLTTYSTGHWIGEAEDATEEIPIIDKVSLTYKDVSCFADVTRKMRNQSHVAIDNLIQTDFNRGLALSLDAGALNGTGTSNEPLGIINTTGINAVTLASAGNPSWNEVVDMETSVGEDNALNGKLGYMCSPTVFGTMKKTQKVAGEATMLIEDNRLNGYPVYVTNQMPAGQLLFGNWQSLLIGIFGVGFEMVVDTNTLSRSGGLRLSAFLPCDTAVRHPESFCLASAV
jgi:HK97 family phage major capsid protein